MQSHTTLQLASGAPPPSYCQAGGAGRFVLNTREGFTRVASVPSSPKTHLCQEQRCLLKGRGTWALCHSLLISEERSEWLLDGLNRTVSGTLTDPELGTEERRVPSLCIFEGLCIGDHTAAADWLPAATADVPRQVCGGVPMKRALEAPGVWKKLFALLWKCMS